MQNAEISIKKGRGLFVLFPDQFILENNHCCDCLFQMFIMMVRRGRRIEVLMITGETNMS